MDAQPIDKEIVKELLSNPEIQILIEDSDYVTLFSNRGPLAITLDNVHDDDFHNKVNQLAKSLYKVIGNRLFYGMREIPYNFLSGFLEFKSVALPEGIDIIKGNAFCNCPNLKVVLLPKSLTTIASWAFSDCKSLESITIPENVTTIYFDAFSGCKNLKEVRFEKLPEKLNDNAFDNSSTTFYIPEFDSKRDKKYWYNVSINKLRRVSKDIVVV